MALCWLALTLSAVIILRLASVSLPAEMGGFASFPVEELESFFVEPCCLVSGVALMFFSSSLSSFQIPKNHWDSRFPAQRTLRAALKEPMMLIMTLMTVVMR